MLLKDKNAVIYGGGGAVGGVVARAFAREGARVFLAGRTLAKLEHVAADISAAARPRSRCSTRWTNAPSIFMPMPSRRRPAASTSRRDNLPK